MTPQQHQGGYVGGANSVSVYGVGGGGPSGSSNGKIKKMTVDEEKKLFGDVPEGKKRKFILVDEPSKGRVRVRVTLDTVSFLFLSLSVQMILVSRKSEYQC
jgi:hypothetical protein